VPQNFEVGKEYYKLSESVRVSVLWLVTGGEVGRNQ